jgi:3-hydroxyisobutyrate dehydrogenase-like beta-hydroxyacid dehydrogenase
VLEKLSKETRKRVGVLGLGKMGSAIANNILSKEYELHVYNRTEQKASELKAKGALFHSTPRNLGESVDIAITSLIDHDAVEKVVYGENGLLKGLAKGSLWIDASTIDPDASKRHAHDSSLHGIERLDAPVSGSPERALQGKLVIYVGGVEDLFRKHEKFLSDIGTPVYMGIDGNGHKMKLLINMYLGTMSVVFAEGLVLSEKMGFSPSVFVDTLNKTAHKSSFTENKGPKVAKGDFTATFTLDGMLKDMRLSDEQARKNGCVLPIASTAAQLFTAASNLGYGSKDFSAIALEIQRISGLKPAPP